MFGRSDCGSAHNPEFRRAHTRTVKRKNVVRLNPVVFLLEESMCTLGPSIFLELLYHNAYEELLNE
jgi:hypothetical protein